MFRSKLRTLARLLSTNYSQPNAVIRSIKGIKLHPETESYLERVETLTAQVVTTGLRSPQVETELAQLRKSSLRIIEDNPFAVANKSSTLEKIKDKMRQRTGESFARDAFTNFWNQTYLESKSW